MDHPESSIPVRKDPPKVVVIIDGPDPDNYILLLAATCTLMGYEVVAVFMTGRPVSAAKGTPPFGINAHASRAVRRDNALHAKGILMRHGREKIPVFEGLRAPFSTVPHHLHLQERVTDVHDDAHAGHVLAGDIDDGVVYLSGLEGPLHIVCGGPLTDLAYLLYQPLLAGKFGLVTAQLGMFGSSAVKTMAGGRRQFNALADPKAARDVLQDYPGAVYLLPTDITKDPRLAIESPEVIRGFATSSAAHEVADMYERAWPNMWGPRGEWAYAHDFHPGLLMAELLKFDPPHHENPSSGGGDRIGTYTVSPVGIEHVPYLPHEQDRWGEIDLGPADLSRPPRFLTDGLDTGTHFRDLAACLNAGPYERSSRELASAGTSIPR